MTGEPAVHVTTDGPDTELDIEFEFEGLAPSTEISLLHRISNVLGDELNLTIEDFDNSNYVDTNRQWRSVANYGVTVVDVSAVDTIQVVWKDNNQYVAGVALSNSDVIGTAAIEAWYRKPSNAGDVLTANTRGYKYAFVANDTSGGSNPTVPTLIKIGKTNQSKATDNKKNVVLEFGEIAEGNYIGSAGYWRTLAVSTFKVSNPIFIPENTDVYIMYPDDANNVNPYIASYALFPSYAEAINKANPAYYEQYPSPIGAQRVQATDSARWLVVNNFVNTGGGLIDNVYLEYNDYSINVSSDSAGSYVHDSVKLSLPNEYQLVVGDTFELFWKGIIQAVNLYNYNIRATCSIGSCYSRKFEVTPSATGTFPLTISIEDNGGNVLDTATVNLVVNEVATSPATTKNVLCVGDSLLSNGQWAFESYRRLTASGGTPIGAGLTNIDYIGTKTLNGAGFEGYGGWTFYSYNTSMASNEFVWVSCTHTKTAADQHSIYQDTNGAHWKIETIEPTRLKMIRTSGTTAMPSSGTLTYVSGGTDTSNIVYTSSATAAGNPFWNESSESVDFAAYASRLGVSTIDYCYVMLGWNSTGASESAYKSQVRTFIDNLLSDFPNCKIAVMGIEVPSLDGIGRNYGCSWNYYDKLKKVFVFNKWYAEIADEYANVHFVNIAGQFDTENNMQTDTRFVNVRNSATEVYQSNGVHPATSGYNQIADAVYRDITAQLQ